MNPNEVKYGTVEIASIANVSEILDALTSELSHEDLFNFIVELDMRTSDYDFTNRLFEHFKQEMETENNIVG